MTGLGTVDAEMPEQADLMAPVTATTTAAASPHLSGLAGLAAFWPPKDAQRCLLLRTNEYCFGSSAGKRGGSERA
jgi:hypothetical protein